MTHEDLENMVLNHDYILKGTKGQPGVAEKNEIMWNKHQMTSGKNSVVMLIKDIILSGGMVGILVKYFLENH